MFSAVIILLATHGSTGLTVAFIGTAAGILSLILSGREAAGIIKNLDYKTLLFFIGLFMVVGGLEQTGALDAAANIISMVSGGNIGLTIFIIIWLSGIASAFVDNIPFSATMIPVIRSLASVSGYRSGYAGMGSCNGNRYRRKRYSHRSLRQCSRYLSCP